MGNQNKNQNKCIVLAVIEYDGQPDDGEAWVRDALSGDPVGNVFLSSGQTDQPIDLEQQLLKYGKAMFERPHVGAQN